MRAQRPSEAGARGTALSGLYRARRTGPARPRGNNASTPSVAISEADSTCSAYLQAPLRRDSYGGSTPPVQVMATGPGRRPTASASRPGAADDAPDSRGDVAGACVGGDRRPALRAGLPPRLPPDRQPPRRRGPDPGGLRPGVPLAVVVHARAPSRAGCTGSPPTCSSTRPAARPRSASTRSADDAETRIPSRAVAPDAPGLDGLFDDDVESALAELPPDFRAAVVLCDIEGLSYEEIADVLGLKLGTVRSRIHRGRTMLRKALAHRAPARAAPATPVPPSPPSSPDPAGGADGSAAPIRPAAPAATWARR